MSARKTPPLTDWLDRAPPVLPDDPDPEDPDPDDPDPLPDPLVLFGEEVGGAALAKTLTADHEAALFACVLFWSYGMNETPPVLSSWTNEVIPAKYVALGSLVAGPAIACVVLVCNEIY